MNLTRTVGIDHYECHTVRCRGRITGVGNVVLGAELRRGIDGKMDGVQYTEIVEKPMILVSHPTARLIHVQVVARTARLPGASSRRRPRRSPSASLVLFSRASD